MDTDTRFKLIKSVGEGGEIVNEEELRHLLDTNDHPVAYDGFEPSGVAHIPFGLLRAENLKNLIKAGVKFKLWLADYFAFINNKMDGDIEKIQKCGEYFIEVWKACGIDTHKVEMLWASEKMDKLDYWDRVLRVGREITINRSMRATTIMGRKQGELQSTAQLFYPCMQVSDIFELDVDICQLGMDQRRANVLAREIADKMRWKKPVLVHHHMIMGLQGVVRGEDEDDTILSSKMSKSKPETCIYMHDTETEIYKKINNAFCQEKAVEGSPLFDYMKFLIFKQHNEVKIERPEKFGGTLVVNQEELIKLYREGKIHPLDLKNATAFYINEMVSPVREHFEKDKKAKELYDMVRKYKITR